jgi:hypothetical protein
MVKNKQNKMKSITFNYCVEVDGEEVELEFEGTLGSDGIGAYEFWGAKGYDAGHTTIEEIFCLTKNLSSEIAAVVTDLLDNPPESLYQAAYDAMEGSMEDCRY